MMAWILPTHMWTHIIRFALVLSVMWGGTLWLLLRQGLSKSRPEEDPVFMILFCGLVGAISLAWIYWYHHSVLFAIGKPWMNPQIPAFNRKEMHVPLRLFDSIEKARRAACLPHMVAYNSTPKLAEKDPSTITSTDYLSPNVLLLDSIGTWQFQLLSSVEDGLALVQRETTHMQGNDSGDKWSTTQVPGHWMLQGFNDIPIYTNKKYPFPANPPIVPRENPTGVYKLLVELPDDWNHAKDQEYSIMLHGVESACFVYWNGHLLGFFKDSRLPSEFQIPSELSSHGTTAVLHLVVARWSDGSYMEDQDHWWMAGVHRSIELIRRPARADILDYRVLATASRTLSVAVRLRHNPSASTSILTVKLYDDIQITPDGDRWSPAQDELWSQSKQVESSSTMPTTFLLESSTIPQVQLWTAETPNLYTLLLVQSDASTGKILQAESCRVGFRSIEIRGDGILRVNGERVTICGINRHEHDPDHGKVVSLERMKQDIVILKYVCRIIKAGNFAFWHLTHELFVRRQNNFNAIRTSHYPTHSSFYRLCDFYGMCVVVED